VVTQVRALAVTLAFVDRIAGLTEWSAPTISATLELREQVREALNECILRPFENPKNRVMAMAD
jgi:hypothetical protein